MRVREVCKKIIFNFDYFVFIIFYWNVYICFLVKYSLPYAKMICKTGYDGTSIEDLRNAILFDSRIVLSHCKIQPPIRELNSWLDEGNSVILTCRLKHKSSVKKVNQYSFKRIKSFWGGHFVFISGRCGDSYYVCNDEMGLTLSKWSRHKISYYLKNIDCYGRSSHVFFLRKPGGTSQSGVFDF